jgi:branched-chain amino acid transport system substrate-binding protein
MLSNADRRVWRESVPSRVIGTLICRLFFVLLLAIFVRSAAAESIQLERQGGIYMVRVRINDAIIIPFVLDSGASEVQIPDDVFSVLRRTGTISQSDFIGTGTYVLADGSATSSDRYVLHKMSVGDHVISDVVANVVSAKGNPLLGQSFLSRLPGWAIDNAQHALVFNGAGVAPAPDRAPRPSEHDLRAPGPEQSIAIALVGPLTGSIAAFGEQMKRGGEMAVADVNAKGGVLGKKLELILADDACDPKQAVAAANDVVGKKVVFVAGHFCSSSSIAASAVYNEAGVLQMTPASSNPVLTDDAAKKGWNYVFRACGRDDAQGAVAGKYLADHYKGKHVAIVHDKTAYGKGIADETTKAMNAAGLKEVMYEAITQGDKDFSALVSKMKQANIDVIYFGGYQTEGGLIVRQMRDQGFKAQFIGADALSAEEFWKITGPAGEGAMMTFPPDPRKVPAAKAVVNNFIAQKYNPEGYTLYTYAAVQAFAAAADKAKSVKVDDLSKSLHCMTIATVIGPLTWDKKGDVIDPKYVFYVWKRGTFAEM